MVQLTVGSALQMVTAPSRESVTVRPRMSTRSLSPMNLILSLLLKAWRTDRKQEGQSGPRLVDEARCCAPSAIWRVFCVCSPDEKPGYE